MEPPLGREVEFEYAVERLSKGAARGVILLQLERQDIPKHECRRIMDAAKFAVERRRRMEGWIAVAIGVAIIGISGCFFFLLPIAKIVAKLSVVILLFGIMMIMYGIRVVYECHCRMQECRN